MDEQSKDEVLKNMNTPSKHDALWHEAMETYNGKTDEQLMTAFQVLSICEITKPQDVYGRICCSFLLDQRGYEYDDRYCFWHKKGEGLK